MKRANELDKHGFLCKYQVSVTQPHRLDYRGKIILKIEFKGCCTSFLYMFHQPAKIPRYVQTQM